METQLAEVTRPIVAGGQSTLPFFIVWPFYLASFYTQWAFILLGGLAFEAIVTIYGMINWTYHFIVHLLFFWCGPCKLLLDWSQNLITLPFELLEWTWSFVLWVIDFAFVWWIKLFFWEDDSEGECEPCECEEDDEECECEPCEEEEEDEDEEDEGDDDEGEDRRARRPNKRNEKFSHGTVLKSLFSFDNQGLNRPNILNPRGFYET